MTLESSLALAWTKFLGTIEEARASLRCSNSAAWFRGQSDVRWAIIPSLLRYGAREDSDDSSEIRSRERYIEKEKESWKNLLDEKVSLKKALQQNSGAGLRQRYHEVTAASRSAKARIAEAQRDLLRFRAPVNGERELFDEFVFRAGKTHTVGSWEVLAEMRHHGVPTRMLDWTDRLDIALYFALDRYRGCVKTKAPIQHNLRATEDLPLPAIWVLNPFLLSRRSTGRTAVWNLSRDPDYDYYRRILHERSWPFDEPMPTYPPAPIERIRSQRGYFTVLGNSKEPMEVQLGVGIRCLRRVEIEPEAAIFCLDYLSRVQGLSPYEVYRDLDSLGQELTERFVRIQGGRREDEQELLLSDKVLMGNSPNTGLAADG